VTATASSHRFRPVHWTGRAARSIRPGPPAADKVEWADEHLTEREQDLFARMSNPDRRHAIGVAMQVSTQLDDLGLDEDRRRAVVAAALLHDVGKSAAGLRTYGRAVATLSGAVGGKAFAEHWQDTAGFTRRVGLYLRYPELGAEQLMVAGSDPWVIAWAREHHRPEEEWTLPVEVGRVLAAADR
jgi:hypothetical protein